MTQQIRIRYFAQTLALVVGASLTFSAAAVDVFLAAKAYTKTLPDGSTVPMWGYVEDPLISTDGGTTFHGECYGPTTNPNPPSPADAVRQACIDALPDPVSPGPRLELTGGQNNLRVFLSNGLPESTSLIITGQELPFSRNNNGPTWDDGSRGSRGGNLTKRVRSYGREADANGGTERYFWTNFYTTDVSDSGSFIYHSGTHPQKQVYMGLYGAMTKRAPNVAGTRYAYTDVPYDEEVMLFYSEIDPAQNIAVDNGSYETSIRYHARWFLVNGEPYVDGMPDMQAGNVGDRTLLRMFSTAGETHVPTLSGLYMTLHAEDGQPYTWQNGGTGVETRAPRSQYTAMLPPLKTKDAIVVADSVGRYAVHDGNGAMTNPAASGGDVVGGMLRFLNYSAAVPQTDDDDPGLAGEIGGDIRTGNDGGQPPRQNDRLIRDGVTPPQSSREP